jgi:autotransporter-associated beta strand protein
MNVNICMPVFVTRVVAAAVTMFGLTGGAQAAVWTGATNLGWGTSGNWTGGVPNTIGAVADFSQFDVTSDTYEIDMAATRTVGSWIVGDTNGTNRYQFSNRTTIWDVNSGNALLQLTSTAFGNNILKSGIWTLNDNLDVQLDGSATLISWAGINTSPARTLTLTGTGGGLLQFSGSGATIQGALKIVVDNPNGELRLNGNLGAATYTGGTEIKKGTFTYLQSANNFLGANGGITLGELSGTDNATFRIGSANDRTVGKAFTLAANSSGTLKIAASAQGGGTRTYTFSGGVTGDYGLTIENEGDDENLLFTTNALDFSGLLTHTGAGTGTATIAQAVDIGSNVTGLVQNSASSKLILDGAKTFSGPTTVQAGTLELGATGGLSSTTISVASGATFDVSAVTGGFALGSAQTLGGSGTVTGAVSLTSTGSILSPGASPGILSFDTNQAWNAFSYEWEVNDWTGTTAGTAFDQIAITGSLDLSSGTAYQLDLLSLDAGNASGQVPNFAETARSWTILTTTGGITGFSDSLWMIGTSGFSSSPTATGTFSLATGNGGQDLVLTYVPVPEPAAVGLLGVAGLCAGFGLARQRRFLGRR